MSSRFPTLATELVELIAIFLKPADLRSLRLVCREISKKTLNSFARANFATIQTDLSSKSLEQITNIANSEHLAKHVHCLEAKYTPDDSTLGDGFDWPRHSSGRLAEDLDGADLLQNLLSQKLLKCRSFIVHSYGEEGLPPNTKYLRPSEGVGLILSIVAKADLPVHSFTIQSNHRSSLWLDTPRLQMFFNQAPKAYLQMEELVLNCGINSDQWNWVMDLILSAQRLRTLSLLFFDGEVEYTRRLCSLPELNRLEKLTLDSAEVTVDAIVSLLIQNRTTLHSLVLRHTGLDDGTWPTVFGNMKGQFPHLQNLELYVLRQRPTAGFVIFPAMSKYPVVTGSEEVLSDGKVKYDSRRIGSIEDTVRLRYWGRKRWAIGIEYHGKGIDHVLDPLSEATEIV